MTTLILVLLATAGTTPQSDSVWQGLRARYLGLNSLSGKFTETICSDEQGTCQSFLGSYEVRLPNHYRLEVTSPGVHRPLRTDRDFARVRSRSLKIVLLSGRNIRGRLEAWSPSTITLAGDSGPLIIDRREIAKATVEVEL